MKSFLRSESKLDAGLFAVRTWRSEWAACFTIQTGMSAETSALLLQSPAPPSRITESQLCITSPALWHRAPLAGIPLSHPFTCITCSRWGQHSSGGLDCTQKVSVSSCSGWRDSSNSRRRWILLYFLIFMKSTGSIHHFICSISYSYPTCAVTNTPGKSTWHLPLLVNLIPRGAGAAALSRLALAGLQETLPALQGCWGEVILLCKSWFSPNN